MSMMSLNVITVRRHRALSWCQLEQRLGAWRRHMHTRTELTNLSDRVLQDIGMSRCTLDFQACKPFWMA